MLVYLFSVARYNNSNPIIIYSEIEKVYNSEIVTDYIVTLAARE